MSIEVLDPGPLATTQDLGRPGLGGIGVGLSGAADRASLRLANRLVGNPETAAAVEITLGGFAVRAHRPMTVAVTGACPPITVAGIGAAANAVLRIPEGAELRMGAPRHGLRSYLAVRGGIAQEPVLGSRATDTLSGLGPDPLRQATVLPVGPAPAAFPSVDAVPVPTIVDEPVLAIVPGPRADWFERAALTALLSEPFEVTSDSDRIGMRLAGPELRRVQAEELPSEGMVRGSLQVPPSGQPTLFLADHPVTGGYPVIAVVVAADVDAAAQVRPGGSVRFRLAGRTPAR